MQIERHRIIGALVGDIKKTPSARIKYGLLFEAVARQFELVDVYDASLSGFSRVRNAFQVFHPQMQQWRQRFYKNLPAFRTRSEKAVASLRRYDADVILQVGVLFDSQWEDVGKPTVIYTDYTAALAARRPESGRVPFTEQENRQWIDLERCAFERAAHICTRGQFVRNAIINDYGIHPSKVTAIGGGLNFAELPVYPSRQNREAPTVLFIGKDFYRKGGDLLLQAFAMARQQLPELRLIMVTEKPPVLDLPLDGVELIPPTWDREKIAELYQRADVFVLPSRLETWGDVLLEAMAYGLPCIGVAGEAMEEIIEKTGLIVPASDIDALSTALVDLPGNPALRTEWGKAARLRVEHHYTWDQIVSKLSPIIKEVL